MTGSKSRIVFKPLPSDDPVQRCPDIALAQERLGWHPTVKVRDGLKRTIEYFERLLSDGMLARKMREAG
jgi:UDP-glucuronate decarboxylase